MAGGFPITHMTNSNLPAQTKATFLQFTRQPFPNVLPCLSAICRSINNVCSSCLISFFDFANYPKADMPVEILMPAYRKGLEKGIPK